VIETLVRFAVFCLLMHGHRTERQQPQQRGEYGCILEPLLTGCALPGGLAAGRPANSSPPTPRFPYCRSLPRFGGKKQQQQLDLRRVFPKKGHSRYTTAQFLLQQVGEIAKGGDTRQALHQAG
jgi:hypothetical protein